MKRLRQSLYPSLIAVLFFALSPLAPTLAASGSSDAPSAKASPWSITSPTSGFPGDCVPVTFVADVPLSGSTVSLVDASGKTVRTVSAFTAENRAVDGSPRQEASLIALIPLSSTLTPGNYTLQANAIRGTESIGSSTPFVIEDRAFTEEIVALDGANTAIKTNMGPERLAQIEALTRLLNTADPASPRFSGPFKAPVLSTRRTALYGDRRTYRYSSGRSETGIHYGVDFGIATGTPVFASGDGLVVMAEKRITTGWTVVVEHLPGVYSLYYHLDALTTRSGESVRAGTLIGRSGATGLATGPHLHWEFRVAGEAVSPDWFVGKTLF